MVAPLILLDRAFTFRALLGVRHDPSHILTLSAVFALPFLCRRTVARPVRVISAAETKRIATFTLDLIPAEVHRLDTKFAPGLRTPLDLFVVVGVALAVEFQILG